MKVITPKAKSTFSKKQESRDRSPFDWSKAREYSSSSRSSRDSTPANKKVGKIKKSKNKYKIRLKSEQSVDTPKTKNMKLNAN